MELTRSQVLQSLAEHRAKVHSWGVRRLGLFGSIARDQSRPGSDLDFLVEFEPGANR